MILIKTSPSHNIFENGRKLDAHSDFDFKLEFI